MKYPIVEAAEKLRDHPYRDEAEAILEIATGRRPTPVESVSTLRVADWLREFVAAYASGCTGLAAAPGSPPLNVPADHPFDGKPGPVGNGRICLECGQPFGSPAHPGSTLAGEDALASGAAVLADATEDEVDGFLDAIREARGAVPRPLGSPRAEEVIRRLRDQTEPGV